MAVDSRDKGRRGEMQVRDLLRDKTKLTWERVPGSGAYGENHGLKGDVYLPPSQGVHSRFCFEVKWYKDEQISSNILNSTESQLEKWWSQATREAEQMNMKPALVFKKDRGKWFIVLHAYDEAANCILDTMYIAVNKGATNIIIGGFEEWLKNMPIEEIIK